MALMGVMMIKMIFPRFYAILKLAQGACSNFTVFMGHKIETVE